MKITFDTNAWEKIFSEGDETYTEIRRSLQAGRICGYICEAALRIEAVRKDQRSTYFAQPKMSIQTSRTVKIINNIPHICIMSIGPDDEQHPRLPHVQIEKLSRAITHNCRILRGMRWLGLPAPSILKTQTLYALDPQHDFDDRETKQIEAFTFIHSLGVGKFAFDNLGGWNSPQSQGFDQKKFQKACAEWADGEAVAAHIAYANDILCTDDEAQSAGKSVFNRDNRSLISSKYGTKFLTLKELCQRIEP